MGFTICILFVLYKIKLFWNQMEIFGLHVIYNHKVLGNLLAKPNKTGLVPTTSLVNVMELLVLTSNGLVLSYVFTERSFFMLFGKNFKIFKSFFKITISTNYKC
jgi:hypothetical protein